MSVPDFFRPKFTIKGTAITVSGETWDQNGQSVPFALTAYLGGDELARASVVETLRMAAWQAVWLAAQGKSLQVAA